MTSKIYFFAFLLCCTGLGISVFYAVRNPTKHTSTQVDTELQSDVNNIDIGTIRQQETKDVTFRLYNASQNDISLESVHTSCGCTEWHLDKRQLEKGESAELSVTFSSGQGRGAIAATIRIFYKNMETEESGNLFLTVLAEIQPDFELSPPFLTFTAEEKSIQYISLKPCFSENIKVLDFSCTRNYYEVEIVKSDSTESVVKVTFLKEKKLPGEKNAILELKTSSERQPVYQVSLTCDP